MRRKGYLKFRVDSLELIVSRKVDGGKYEVFEGDVAVLWVFVLAEGEIAYSLDAYGLPFMILKDDARRIVTFDIQQGNFVHQDGFTQITKEQSGMMRI